MHILVTGSNGYIAQSITTDFIGEKNFTIDSIHRNIVNLEDKTALSSWFKGKYFDVVIHTATVGGSRLQMEDESVFTRNISMYENLMQHKNRFGKFISFGSGAELFSSNTPYGISKTKIADSIRSTENFYNLRIFAAFDQNELSTRFIKANILRYIRKEPMIIHTNKVMDFIYMPDLIGLIKYYIATDNPPKEVNCSYEHKKNLMEIAGIINSLDSYQVPIEVLDNTMMGGYCGASHRLPVKMVGLEVGIRQTYECIVTEHRV